LIDKFKTLVNPWLWGHITDYICQSNGLDSAKGGNTPLAENARSELVYSGHFFSDQPVAGKT